MNNLQQSLSGLYEISKKLNNKIKNGVNVDINYISGQVSSFINEYSEVSGTFALSTDVTEAISAAKEQLIGQFAGAFHFRGTVSTSGDLANIESPLTGDVYQVNELSSEFAYNGTEWVELGSFVDLSDYYTSTQVDTEITRATSGKLEESTFNTFKTNDYDTFKADYDTLKAEYETTSGTFALSTDVSAELSAVQDNIEYVSGIVDTKADFDYLTGNYYTQEVADRKYALSTDVTFIIEDQLEDIRIAIEQLSGIISA